MNKRILSGILYGGAGSFWWGVIGVIYFKYVAFAGTIELVAHRTFWTGFILFFTTIFFSRLKIFLNIFRNKKKIFYLFLSGSLIFTNWSVWIYAVVTNRLIDGSFGYYIFPILSVFFGYVFFKEKLNLMRVISIILVFISIVYLLFSFKSIPWIGLTVAITWSTYNLLRKKINVETDIGLFIETIFIAPVAIIIFFLLTKEGLIEFSPSKPNIMFLLFLAGPMTVIPLYLYVKGVELAGLGPTGMIFFITPTCQFLIGVFYYNELLDVNKLIGFILIWVAVIIYLRDLYIKKK